MTLLTLHSYIHIYIYLYHVPYDITYSLNLKDAAPPTHEQRDGASFGPGSPLQGACPGFGGFWG